MSGTAPVKEEEPVIGHLNLRQTRDLGVPSSLQGITRQAKSSVHLWKLQEYAGCFHSCRNLSFMATACRSWCFLWQPRLVGSREQLAGPAQGRVRSVSSPAPLLSLGNCCTKFPLTAGLNLREQCALVHFPEISAGIPESSRPAKPFCSLSYSQVLHCCSSLCTWFLFCSSQHTHTGVWPLNQDTRPSKLQFHQRTCF